MSYYDEIKAELQSLIQQFNNSKHLFDERFSEIESQKRRMSLHAEAIKQMARERQIGFPVLAKAYEEYFKLQDKNLVDFLQLKDKPAIKASEVVAEYARIRREAERENKTLRYIIEYYESIAPFLVDLREEVEDSTTEDRPMSTTYTEEEREDQATNYLTIDEYRKLSVSERNQLALERYWKRPKSKWQIGKLYERYVGYLYESQGYSVDYVGIFKGLEDLGRDLIASKDNELVVIQCKNWSKFRTIYEKHIFQFFGTVFQYKDENKNKDVRAVFYTTTKLSDLARRFASELNIDLVEEHKLSTDYPCIKCNIAKDGTRIYHLPFDQQYDNTKIEPAKGELYCATVNEAEVLGYRRAFRYKGASAS